MPTNAEQSNQRRHPRVPTDCPGVIEITLAPADTMRVSTAPQQRKRVTARIKVRDVSLGGLGVVFVEKFKEPVDLAQAATVTVKFALEGRNLAMSGAMAWHLLLPDSSDPFLAGIRLQLETVSSTIRATYEQLVKRKMAEAPPPATTRSAADRGSVLVTPQTVQASPADLLSHARLLLTQALDFVPPGELAEEIRRYLGE